MAKPTFNVYTPLRPTMKIYTTETLAELLGVKPKTIQQWRHQGKGPKYYEPEKYVVRYTEKDVMEWLVANKGEEAPNE